MNFCFFGEFLYNFFFCWHEKKKLDGQILEVWLGLLPPDLTILSCLGNEGVWLGKEVKLG